MENLAKKQEYYGQNKKRAEVCFELDLMQKETHLMNDNLFNISIKLGRQPEFNEIDRFDQSNQIKNTQLIRGRDQMSRDWNEHAVNQPYSLPSFPIVQHNTMPEYSSIRGTTSDVINPYPCTYPNTSTGNTTAHSAANKTNETPSTRALRPWWNDECKDARLLRRKAFRKFNKRPSSEHLKQFKEERAKARRLFRQSRKKLWAINVADY